MNSLDESPLPAPVEVEVVDRSISEVDRERPALEAGEDRIAARLSRLEADPTSVRSPLFQEAGRLGAMVVGHVVS